MIERGMAHVLAMHHVDHVLADVLGMIPDALERPYYPHDVERAPDSARILHHKRDALTLNRLVFLIDPPVLAAGPECGFGIQPGEGIERVMEQHLHRTAQMLDLAVAIGWPLDGRQARSDQTNLLAFIADALDIGNGLDGRDDHTQVAGGGSPGREDAAAVLVDRDLHAIDLVVVPGDRAPQRTVGIDQRHEAAAELILDKTTHRKHFAAHPLEILVKSLRGVVGNVSRFHDKASRNPFRRRPIARISKNIPQLPAFAGDALRSFEKMSSHSVGTGRTGHALAALAARYRTSSFTAVCSRSRGKSQVNLLPRPSWLSIESWAPCRCSTCLTIASPRPEPPVARLRPASTR